MVHGPFLLNYGGEGFCESGKLRDAQPFPAHIGAQAAMGDGLSDHFPGKGLAQSGGQAGVQGFSPLSEGGADHPEEESLILDFGGFGAGDKTQNGGGYLRGG